PPEPPLASLVGLRSRTLTFFFFCSLILPFLVVFIVLVVSVAPNRWKPKNCSQRSATSFQAARRVENRHAGTGEGISYTVWDLFRRWSGRRRLWHPWSA